MSYEPPAPGRTDLVGGGRRRALKILSAMTLFGLSALAACRPAGPDGGAPVGPPTEEPTVSITLAWDPPETDATGAPLADLAGYRLYFGTTSPLVTARDTFVEVGIATTYTLSDLSPGRYCFATTAIDSAGNESELSAEISAELAP